MSQQPFEWMGNLLFKLRILGYLLRCGFEEWRQDVWRRDLDSSYCCDGRECGCAGSTVRELWSWRDKRPQS